MLSLLSLLLIVKLIIVLLKLSSSSSSSSSSSPLSQPKQVIKPRRFLPLPGINGLSQIQQQQQREPLMIRIQQYNILADGLSGLRPDLGGFSRASKDILDWEYRKSLLLHEITQYDADIITMQEVDHYYDFFLPELSSRGYIGYFAQKPTSGCLEVSGNNDGCAMFIRESRFRVVSCQTTTLALSIATINEGELVEGDKNILAQNQVGLIAVCEFINLDNNSNRNNNSSKYNRKKTKKPNNQLMPPPLIIGTTHLKSAKSATGERYRQKGVVQILDTVDRIYKNLESQGCPPNVILTGDFNAIPEVSGYQPLTYRAVKSHKLGLRSIYNEDVIPSSLSSKELYTTWKFRTRKEKSEEVVKRCIDYIFYTPYTLQQNKKDYKRDPVVAYSESQIAISVLLRLAVYLFSAIVPLTSLISSKLETSDKVFVISLALMGLAIFEMAAEGTIFKPQIAARTISLEVDDNDDNKAGIFNRVEAKVEELGKRLYYIGSNGNAPGMRATAALDLYSQDDMGNDLIPSETYPSDHLSIAADFQIIF